MGFRVYSLGFKTVPSFYRVIGRESERERERDIYICIYLYIFISIGIHTLHHRVQVGPFKGDVRLCHKV